MELKSKQTKHQISNSLHSLNISAEITAVAFQSGVYATKNEQRKFLKHSDDHN